MPPPRTAHAGPYLRRSVCFGKAGLSGCAVGWLELGLWLIHEDPSRLGPIRLVGALILVIGTAFFGFMWWSAALRIREHLDTALGYGTDTANQNGYRPHLVNTR